MMTIAAARMLSDRLRLLRRHRPAERGLQPCAADPRARHRADLRIRHHRHPAEVLPLSIGDGELAETAACRGALAGDIQLLPAGRTRRCRLPWRGADRSLRQSQQHGHRPLRHAADAPARRRRRAGNRGPCAGRRSCAEASPRSFVAKLDFRTSAGFLDGGGARGRSAARGARSAGGDHRLRNPHAHPETEELQLTALVRGYHRDEAQAAVGWPLELARHIDTVASADADRTAGIARAQRTHRTGAPAAGADSGHDPGSPTMRSQIQGVFRDNPHIKTELPGPEGAGDDCARCRRDLALLSARLSVRDVAWPRQRSLGRGRQPLPGFHGRHRRLRHRPCAPEGGGGGERGRRRIPAHFQRLLARGHGRPRRAPGEAWRRWASRC